MDKDIERILKIRTRISDDLSYNDFVLLEKSLIIFLKSQSVVDGEDWYKTFQNYIPNEIATITKDISQLRFQLAKSDVVLAFRSYLDDLRFNYENFEDTKSKKASRINKKKSAIKPSKVFIVHGPTIMRFYIH